VKERRGVGRLAGLAEGVAAAARRRQRERVPRVLLYDEEGHPRPLSPDVPAFEEIVAAAERMLELAADAGARAVAEDEAGDPASTDGVSVRATIRHQDRESDARGGTRDQG
jgi:hypothetical protein